MNIEFVVCLFKQIHYLFIEITNLINEIYIYLVGKCLQFLLYLDIVPICMFLYIVAFDTELEQLQNLQGELIEEFLFVIGIDLLFVFRYQNFIELFNYEGLVRGTAFISRPKPIQELRLLLKLPISILNIKLYGFGSIVLRELSLGLLSVVLDQYGHVESYKVIHKVLFVLIDRLYHLED